MDCRLAAPVERSGEDQRCIVSAEETADRHGFTVCILIMGFSSERGPTLRIP